MKRIALCILSIAGCALAQVRVPAGRILDLTQEISPTSPVFFPTMAFSAQQDTEEAKLHIYSRTFKASEHRNGTIPAQSVVIANTGWSARWKQGEPYRNADAKGVMHFPGFSVEAARRLVERKVAGLGIDTLSVDYGPSSDFKVHYTTQPNGIYHIENMANLDQLPAKGATLIVSRESPQIERRLGLAGPDLGYRPLNRNLELRSVREGAVHNVYRSAAPPL